MMSDNLTVFIVIVLILFVLLGDFCITHQTEACKITAFEHNVPVADIKELCK